MLPRSSPFRPGPFFRPEVVAIAYVTPSVVRALSDGTIQLPRPRTLILAGVGTTVVVLTGRFIRRNGDELRAAFDQVTSETVIGDYAGRDDLFLEWPHPLEAFKRRAQAIGSMLAPIFERPSAGTHEYLHPAEPGHAARHQDDAFRRGQDGIDGLTRPWESDDDTLV